jgi:hypothetical protein
MHYSSGLKEVFQKLLKVAAYNFLGKCKSPNYRTLVGNMLKTFSYTGWSMLLKLHFLHFTVIWMCLQANLDMSVMSMMRDFTKMSLLWKNATKDGGVKEYLLTTAGNLQDKLSCIQDERKCKMIHLNCVLGRELLPILI